MKILERVQPWIRSVQTKYGSKPFVWIAAVVIAGFLAFYLDMRSTPASQAPQPEDVESAATFIPAGFVLVPIEVANYESLDSILGKHGIVDLYLPISADRKRPVKVAERVRILRAPLNPGHFAVLVSEAESPRLVTTSEPFTVVVQPLKGSGTKFVEPNDQNKIDSRPKAQRRSRIEIEGV